jgi:hypothetical protein
MSNAARHDSNPLVLPSNYLTDYVELYVILHQVIEIFYNYLMYLEINYMVRYRFA